MAGFKTHLTITSIFSSAGSTILMASAMATPQEVLFYFTMGVTGGLLPDIDSDTSLPVRFLVTFIATVIAFLVMFRQSGHNSAIELFLIWLASFLLIKYLFFYLLTQMTVHRGLMHSVPAGVLFWLVATILLHHLFNFSEFTVWMGGLFIFSGFILHLLIDEFYSLNLSGSKPKKSLGTAFKFGSARNLKTTLALYLAIILLFGFTPPHKDFFSTLWNKESYRNLTFFPKGHWFEECYKKYISELNALRTDF